jgi:hypothetical protein
MDEEERNRLVEEVIRRAHTCWLKIRLAKREANIEWISEQIDKLEDEIADYSFPDVVEGLLQGVDLETITDHVQTYDVRELLAGLGLELE